jgi:hypothetical protein
MPDPARARLVSAPRSLSDPRSGRQIRVLAVCSLLLAAPPVSAQPEPSPERIVELRYAWQAELARQDVAAWTSDLVAAPRGPGLSVGTIQDPAIILKELGPKLDEDYKLLRPGLARLAARTAERRDDVRKEWAEVVRQRAVFRRHVDRQQASYSFDFDSGSLPGLRLTLLDGLLIAWAVAALLVTLRLRAKELRLELRRARRAATAGLLVAALAPAFPGCGRPPAGADARPWLVREQEQLTAATAEAAARTTATTAEAAKKWQAAIDGWARLVTSPTDSVDSLVLREEKAIHDKLHEALTDARLTDRLARDAEQQREVLTDEKARLDGLIAGSRWRSTLFSGLRVTAAALLLGASVTPFWTVRRARRAAARLRERTCPRCGARDRLEAEPRGGDPAPGRYKGKKRAKEPTPPDEDAEGLEREVRCGNCGLRVRQSYLSLPRFCIPTVGVRSSGKTHMLVTAYDRIRRRTAPTVATLQPAPSTRDRETETRFEQLIDLVLNRRAEAGFTDLALPNPILIHLKDADPAGANSALLNLFDYSGELINLAVDVNLLRQTAVRMDGFMLFLDPTQLYGDGANVTLDQQLGMLDEFLDHMRRARKVPVGEVIPVPVAVCIPKFDLLVSDNPIGRQSIRYIRELLENLSPPPRQTTLEVLRERSDLVEQMLPLMFPGADIRRIIEGYFGRQLLFFPMSSVSLFEHELGVRNLEERTMAPWGVAEPILWLMHMHGYDVFAPAGE